MNGPVLLANTYPGMDRAERQPEGAWVVERVGGTHEVTCLAADPHHPGTILAGTRQNGLIRSEDSGCSWQPAGLAGTKVRSVAFSPSTAGLVIVGTKPPMLFKSQDGGATWTELPAFRQRRQFWWFSPAEIPEWTPYVQAVAISPTDPNLMLAGIELGAVLRSLDGGETWSAHRRGALRDCHSLCFHATDGRYAYEGGGSGAGASMSRDGGDTWTQRRAGLDRHYGWAAAGDPATPKSGMCLCHRDR